jgi:hypothetical protein
MTMTPPAHPEKKSGLFHINVLPFIDIRATLFPDFENGKAFLTSSSIKYALAIESKTGLRK